MQFFIRIFRITSELRAEMYIVDCILEEKDPFSYRYDIDNFQAEHRIRELHASMKTEDLEK